MTTLTLKLDMSYLMKQWTKRNQNTIGVDVYKRGKNILDEVAIAKQFANTFKENY